MSETVDESALVLPDIRQAPVPKHLAKCWADMVASRARPSTLRTVYRVVVLDQPWRAAAQEEGVEHKQAWRLARRFGLVGRKDRDLTIRQTQRIVDLAAEELEERLLQEPGKVGDKELNAVWGTGMDKLARHWERRQESPDYVSALDRLAQQLEGGSGTVTLQLRVERDDTAVDVTPSSEG